MYIKTYVLTSNTHLSINTYLYLNTYVLTVNTHLILYVLKYI